MIPKEIQEALKDQIREAYQDGKAGSPCQIWPDLTEQTSPEEIERAASTLPVAPGGSTGEIQFSRTLYLAYISAWQKGQQAAKAEKPTEPVQGPTAF